MKQKTKTSNKKDIATSSFDGEVLVRQLNRDVRDSVLVVSVLINLYIFVAWLVIQVASNYDNALINYIQHN